MFASSCEGTFDIDLAFYPAGSNWIGKESQGVEESSWSPSPRREKWEKGQEMAEKRESCGEGMHSD
jgi:hypothetical protein